MNFIPLRPRMRDLSGFEYGRLLVLGHAGDKHWWCECECGKLVKVWGYNLTKGNTTSCGCRRLDTLTVHGYSSHREFNVWRNIKGRCLDSTYSGYEAYGGRGIKLHEEWASDDPRPFCDWIDENLGPRPKGCTLDRIDNDGHYEPGNLRWATLSQQYQNSRRQKWSKYDMSAVDQSTSLQHTRR